MKSGLEAMPLFLLDNLVNRGHTLLKLACFCLFLTNYLIEKFLENLKMKKHFLLCLPLHRDTPPHRRKVYRATLTAVLQDFATSKIISPYCITSSIDLTLFLDLTHAKQTTTS